VAAACGTAASAPPVVRLTAIPRGLVVGKPWTATLVVRGHGHPTLLARRGQDARSYATRKGWRGRWTARVVFPHSGRWLLSARLRNRAFPLGRVVVAEAPPVELTQPLAGAAAWRSCGGATSFIPQFTIAYGFGSLWIACRESREVLRVDPETAAVVSRMEVNAAPSAIAITADAVYALERNGELLRINPSDNRIAARMTVPGFAAYVWGTERVGLIGIENDVQGAVHRIASDRIGDGAQVGNGPSDVAASGSIALVICHRDGTLWRLDLDSLAAARLGSLPGEAPERMVRAAGSLWVTGRGTDLLRVDPSTGAMQATIDVGVGAIDLETLNGEIWVFAPSPEDDRQGLPQVAHVLRVDAATNRVVADMPVTQALTLTGVTTDGAHIWLSDTANGKLVRLG
jgi:hypothetical protein